MHLSLQLFALKDVRLVAAVLVLVPTTHAAVMDERNAGGHHAEARLLDPLRLLPHHLQSALHLLQLHLQSILPRPLLDARFVAQLVSLAVADAFPAVSVPDEVAICKESDASFGLCVQ